MDTRILLTGASPNTRLYGAALTASGFAVTLEPDCRAALAALAADRDLDLFVWDAVEQGREIDEGFDGGRVVTDVPILLLVDRPYPFLEMNGRRPGFLDYYVRPSTANDVVEVAKQSLRLRTSLRCVRDAAALIAKAAELLRQAEAGLPASPGAAPASRIDRTLLSPREAEIGDALVSGKSPREIGPLLGVTVHTVRNHLKNMFRKLRVNSQVEMIAVLTRHSDRRETRAVNAPR